MTAITSAMLIMLAAASLQTDYIHCLPAQKADCSGMCLTGRRHHGCIEPPPVPGQCSFPRKDAVALCSRWQRCAAVNCATSRQDCQARGSNHKLLPSFGDAEVFIPATETNFSRVCHARLRRELKISRYASDVRSLHCSALGHCNLRNATQELVRGEGRRLHRLSQQSRVVEAYIQSPPLLYFPVVTPHPVVAPDAKPIPNEEAAYRSTYASHYFLADAQYVFAKFFPFKTDGFFIEVGGLNGAADGSNSWFFERYRNWRGLMAEASPLNFARLFTRRPFAYRLEAALGPAFATLEFSGHGCCGKVAGGSESYHVRSMPIGAVLRAMGIQHVDFWSLDVRRKYRTPLSM